MFLDRGQALGIWRAVGRVDRPAGRGVDEELELAPLDQLGKRLCGRYVERCATLLADGALGDVRKAAAWTRYMLCHNPASWFIGVEESQTLPLSIVFQSGRDCEKI